LLQLISVVDLCCRLKATPQEETIMSIDWNVVATILSPIIALFVGAWVNRKFENRPSLISYFGHVSAFKSTTDAGVPFLVHTHSVVLRNTGRKSATNIRLHHMVLPDFNIYPPLVHHKEKLPDGSEDILIPILVPGEQITISYLYFPPLVVSEINAGIKFDQGFAHQIKVLLQRQYPRWWNITAAFFMLIGMASIIYILYFFLSNLLR
jgi:hypothetical protein